MDPLFAPLPEDITSLSDEALTEALEARLGIVSRIEENDAEVLGDRAASDIVAELQAGVEQIEAIRAEQTARVEAAAEYEATVADLASRVRPEETLEADTDGDAPEGDAPEGDAPEGDAPEGDNDGDEGEASAEVEALEVEAVEEPEPVVAAAEPVVRMVRPPRARRERQPVATEDAPQGRQLVASAGIRGIQAGETLDRDNLGRALVEAHRVTSARPGEQVRVVVASAHTDYPEDRILGDDAAENTRRIEAVTEHDAIVAAGGICAPLTPLYDLPILSVADRPVRAALAGFQATRGGISVPTPLSLAERGGRSGRGHGRRRRTGRHLRDEGLRGGRVRSVHGRRDRGDLRLHPARQLRRTHVAGAGREPRRPPRRAAREDRGDRASRRDRRRHTAVTEAAVYGADLLAPPGRPRGRRQRCGAVTGCGRRRASGRSSRRGSATSSPPTSFTRRTRAGSTGRATAQRRCSPPSAASTSSTTSTPRRVRARSSARRPRALSWSSRTRWSGTCSPRARGCSSTAGNSTSASSATRCSTPRTISRSSWRRSRALAKVGIESLKITSTVCPSGAYPARRHGYHLLTTTD